MWHLLVAFGALACLSVGFAAGMLLSPGHKSSGETKTVVQVLSVAGDPQANDDAAAKANVRSVIPAMEAYNADNTGTGDAAGYAGVSMETLTSTYDSSLYDDTATIAFANATTYCIESTVGNSTWSKNGPGAEIRAGRLLGASPRPRPSASYASSVGLI